MIVADDTVSKALAYLSSDPHPLALARKDVTDAENEASRLYATVYGEQTGSIKDKEMATDRDERVVASRNVVSGSLLDLERHKARAKAAEMIIEVWRSENANARAAERVR
jgi:hypothetical protein